MQVLAPERQNVTRVHHLLIEWMKENYPVVPETWGELLKRAGKLNTYLREFL